MSREKTVRVNKEKVMKRLEEIGLTQKQLADSIPLNPQYFNRALQRERFTEEIADHIGRKLDLAPEYLADEDGVLDYEYLPDGVSVPASNTFQGAPHNYALHLAQESYKYPFDGVQHMLRWMMVKPEDLTAAQKKELFMRSYQLFAECLEEWRLR